MRSRSGLLRPDGKRIYEFLMRKASGRMEASFVNLGATPAYASDDAQQALLAAIRTRLSSTLKVTDKFTGSPSVSIREFLKEHLEESIAACAMRIADGIGSPEQR